MVGGSAIAPSVLMFCTCTCTCTHKFYVPVGAFYYTLGNMKPSLRSKLNSIQLLLLAKYSSVAEFGIDRMLEPIIDDIKKLESVC